MIRQKFRIQIGSKIIEDMYEPKPEELDLEAIDANLRRTIRFASAPGAINVHQHRKLVVRLIELDKLDSFGSDAPSEDLWRRCCEWANHHDDHEGIIGDIVAPVKTLISAKTNILEIVEIRLDQAICAARGIQYPNEVVRGLVHRYDKAAETIEWCYALERPQAPWNHPCPDHLFQQGKQLVAWARAHA